MCDNLGRRITKVSAKNCETEERSKVTEFMEKEADVTRPLTIPKTPKATALSMVTPAAIISLGVVCTGLLSNQIDGLLRDYEVFQSWRYLWPLVGAVYAWDGAASLFPEIQFPPFSPLASETIKRARFVSLLTLLAGIGLVIGGAADALLPVYITGPNLFTSAGLGPDSAAFLLLMTVLFSIRNVMAQFDPEKCVDSTGSPVSNFSYNSMSIISERLEDKGFYKQIIVWVVLTSQLYVLGESSFDEMLSSFDKILSSFI
mmetsp:Transcript_21793/g.22166  ORF Transcript_21793/g.22166 Transcript_21793/m.22166 type:complete len:259 (-) Transcript_21793:4-780(-)